MTILVHRLGFMARMRRIRSERSGPPPSAVPHMHDRIVDTERERIGRLDALRLFGLG